MLQNIQNELSNDQEELASYQICVSLKSSSQTPGMTEILRNAMDLVESKISCHLHKFPPTGKPYQTAFSDHSLFPSNIDNNNYLETAVDNLTTNIITAYNLASKPLHNKSTFFLPLQSNV
ncbi:hypothetical protein CEXT_107011 [Caerostris extrusa]|uniref:Uncharacterized protein n=1 Tax=Caerostris extrusa TaxID=172846 RepID=A0AAV4NM78_CAEEX|nr:hypothetical protein CEXT_107011 [Caerostris extrusa]